MFYLIGNIVETCKVFVGFWAPLVVGRRSPSGVGCWVWEWCFWAPLGDRRVTGCADCA